MRKTEIEAIIEILRIYGSTDSPVTQQFYQGLCEKAKKTIVWLYEENKDLKAVAKELKG